MTRKRFRIQYISIGFLLGVCLSYTASFIVGYALADRLGTVVVHRR